MEDKFNGLHVYKSGEEVDKTIPTDNDFIDDVIDQSNDDGYRYSDQFEDYALDEKPKKSSKIAGLVGGLFKKKHRYEGKYADPMDSFMKSRPSMSAGEDDEEEDLFDDEPIVGRAKITQFSVTKNASKLGNSYNLDEKRKRSYTSSLGKSSDNDNKFHR